MRIKHSILLVIFMLLSGVIKSQDFPVDKETGLVNYTDIVTIDSISAKKLYKRAKIYFTDKYKSAKDVIQLDDTTQIIGKAFTDIIYETGMFLAPTVVYKFNYTISIQFKEGKYKYSVSRFSVENYPVSVNGKIQNPTKEPIESWVNQRIKFQEIPEKNRKLWLKNYKMLISTSQSIVNELKLAMTKNEDW